MTVENHFLLDCMINMNMPEGLQGFIEESRTLKHPVDANNNTSNLTITISNIWCSIKYTIYKNCCVQQVHSSIVFGADWVTLHHAIQLHHVTVAAQPAN